MDIPQVRSPQEIADKRLSEEKRQRDAYREKVGRQLIYVENEIKNNFAKGECTITDTSLYSETSRALDGLGYKVQMHPYQLLSSPPQYRWTISWPVQDSQQIGFQ